MKKIERLKTSRESNFQEETIGQKVSQFRNKLNDNTCNVKDYMHAKNVYNKFNC